MRDRNRETAVHAVELQQMRVGFHRTEVIDGNHLDIGAAGFDDGTQDVAADAAKAIDGDFYGHGMGPLCDLRAGAE